MATMKTIPFGSLPMLVYVVMGIDEHEHDRVLAVCWTYEHAKNYCAKCRMQTDYFDMWIEKHKVVDDYP